MRAFAILTLAVVTLAAPGRVFAQQDAAKPTVSPQFYRLVFSVEETGDSGKVTNSRSYFTTVQTEERDNSYPDQIRTGNRLPLRTSDKGDLQYIDVGVNIDTNQAHAVDGRLALQVTTEISSVANPSNGQSAPLIRQNTWKAEVIVPIGKPTVIFSSDNVDNKGKMQVELTATRIE